MSLGLALSLGLLLLIALCGYLAACAGADRWLTLGEWLWPDA